MEDQIGQEEGAKSKNSLITHNTSSTEQGNALDKALETIQLPVGTLENQHNEHEYNNEFDQDFQKDTKMLNPDDPLLKSVQEALFKQLSKKLNDIVQTVKEKSIESKTATKERESVGVELYHNQQSLGQLQHAIDDLNVKLEENQDKRQNTEDMVKKIQQDYESKNQLLKEKQSNLRSRKEEIIRNNKIIKQFEIYEAELKSKIDVTKREVEKRTDLILKNEAEKKRQDFYVDGLVQKIHQLEEDHNNNEYQLKKQRKENSDLHSNLIETKNEINNINTDKRMLLNQWKASIHALERRESVLNQLKNEINNENESLNLHVIQLAGFKKSNEKAQENLEKTMALVKKLENEVEMINRQIVIIGDSKAKLVESYEMYSKTLQKSEEEFLQVNAQSIKLRNEQNNMEKQYHKLRQICNKLEAEILEEMQNQTGMDYSKSGTIWETKKLREELEEKLDILAQTETETARLKLQILDSIRKNQTLQSQASEYEEEINEKNKMIEKSESDIQKRSTEMKKKQSEMEVLNKKYDAIVAQELQLTGKIAGEIGPLESTIYNLGRQLGENQKQSIDMQKTWLKIQNDLVTSNKKISEIHEEIKEKDTEKSILERKKSFIDSQLSIELGEIREYDKDVKKIRNEIMKLNSLISKNETLHGHLKETNLNLLVEFKCRLKQAEDETIKLERMIETHKFEKEMLTEKLLDTEYERQILVWEKKIQLAKETALAIDPNVGSADIKEMEKEISQMKTKHTFLLQAKEKLITDIQTFSMKHVDLGEKAYRAKVISPTDSKRGQKILAELKKNIKMATNEVRQAETEIHQLVESQQTLKLKLENIQKNCEKLLQQKMDGEIALRVMLLERKSTWKKLYCLQNRVKRYQELKDGKYVPLSRQLFNVEDDILQQKEKINQLLYVLKELQQFFPDIQPLVNEIEICNVEIE